MLKKELDSLWDYLQTREEDEGRYQGTEEIALLSRAIREQDRLIAGG